MKARELARHIDHTCLTMDATPEKIQDLCHEAMEWNVASVCVPPAYVVEATQYIESTSVNVGTVIGFPFGYSHTYTKISEAEIARKEGAKEIDIVMNLGRFKAGEVHAVEAELRSIIRETPGMIHKVIIECALLNYNEKKEAVQMVIQTGSEFIKTSTGFGPGGASVDDVTLLYKESEGKIKVKASGGIRDLETTLKMIRAGAERIGTSSALQILSDCCDQE